MKTKTTTEPQINNEQLDENFLDEPVAAPNPDHADHEDFDDYGYMEDYCDGYFGDDEHEIIYDKETSTLTVYPIYLHEEEVDAITKDLVDELHWASRWHSINKERKKNLSRVPFEVRYFLGVVVEELKLKYKTNGKTKPVSLKDPKLGACGNSIEFELEFENTDEEYDYVSDVKLTMVEKTWKHGDRTTTKKISSFHITFDKLIGAARIFGVKYFSEMTRPLFKKIMHNHLLNDGMAYAWDRDKY